MKKSSLYLLSFFILLNSFFSLKSMQTMRNMYARMQALRQQLAQAAFSSKSSEIKKRPDFKLTWKSSINSTKPSQQPQSYTEWFSSLFSSSYLPSPFPVAKDAIADKLTEFVGQLEKILSEKYYQSEKEKSSTTTPLTTVISTVVDESTLEKLNKALINFDLNDSSIDYRKKTFLYVAALLKSYITWLQENGFHNEIDRNTNSAIKELANFLQYIYLIDDAPKADWEKFFAEHDFIHPLIGRLNLRFKFTEYKEVSSSFPITGLIDMPFDTEEKASYGMIKTNYDIYIKNNTREKIIEAVKDGSLPLNWAVLRLGLLDKAKASWNRYNNSPKNKAAKEKEERREGWAQVEERERKQGLVQQEQFIPKINNLTELELTLRTKLGSAFITSEKEFKDARNQWLRKNSPDKNMNLNEEGQWKLNIKLNDELAEINNLWDQYKQLKKIQQQQIKNRE
jgi:hypothetical protein